MMEINKILPEDIISDILTRLPTESILECKLVCKKWNHLIHHRRFPQMQLAHLNHPNSTDSGKLRYVFLDEYDELLYYFEYEDNEDWNYVMPIHRKIMIQAPFAKYIVIGSFNGLICLYGVRHNLPYADGPAYIFNPVTKEYVVLPRFEKDIQYIHMASGFGYVASTNEYKVVRIYISVEEPNVVEVEVYTVGSGIGWRHVGKTDFGFIFDPDYKQTHGVFWNEALHWRNSAGGMVVVFDLADEKFREYVSPPPLPMDNEDDADIQGYPVIGVSGGGILYYAVCQHGGGRTYSDVWLLMKKNDDHAMKEKGEHQSWGWSKVISLDQKEPFAYLEGGKLVLRYDQGTLNIFISQIRKWSTLIDSSQICSQAYPHKHTLISLKDLGEESAQIMEKDFEETKGSN